MENLACEGVPDMSTTITLVDENGLLHALERASKFRYDQVVRKTLTEMRNRAVGNYGNPMAGGTPYDTGELRMSANVNFGAEEFGYIKDYAPHVEYGHRTRGGGYVPGQKFLFNNVRIQAPILERDTLNALKELI